MKIYGVIPSRYGSKRFPGKPLAVIKGKPLIDIFESFDGSYWYVIEKAYKQDSVIDGKVHKNDQIFFGYVRLSACPEFAEFGYFSEAELKQLGNWVWKVPRKNWEVCPEVEVKNVAIKPGKKARLIFIISEKHNKRRCSKLNINRQLK